MVDFFHPPAARSATVRDSLLGPKRIIECSPPTYCGDEVGFSLPKTERKKREGERDFWWEFFLKKYIVIHKIHGTLLVESFVFFSVNPLFYMDTSTARGLNQKSGPNNKSST